MTNNINSLPQLDLIDKLNSFHNLSDIDPDENLPTQTNFKYYTTQEFAKDEQIKSCTNSNKCFSALHANIRSLNANFDNLTQLLVELNNTFSVIGLTETNLQSSRDQQLNVSIPGYEFISQPSLSRYGGASFFVSKRLNYSVRNEFSESKPHHDALWIEIESELHHNLVCGVIYRHHRSDIDAFLTYLNDTIDKVNRENKYCILMVTSILTF